MSRGLLWTATVTLIVGLVDASPAGAQTSTGPRTRPDRFQAVFVSVNFGAQPGRMDLGDSIELIQQVTNQTVNGVVVTVPSTSVTVLGTNLDHAAFLFSARAGFNQHMGSWIVGVEGGIDFANGSSDVSSQTFSIPATLLTPLTSVMTTRQAVSTTGWSIYGRAGKLFFTDFLLYGSFGVTGGGRKVVAVDTWSNVPGGPGLPGPGGATVNLGPLGPYVVTVDENRHTGVLFGFGVEKPVNDTWSWGADYQYAVFSEANFKFEETLMDVQGPVSQSHDFQGASAGAFPGNTTVKSTDHRISVRLVYRLPFTLPFLR